MAINNLIGSLFTLPSGNLIKVTGVLLDEITEEELVTSVYIANRDPTMKRLVVSLKWFDLFANER